VRWSKHLKIYLSSLLATHLTFVQNNKVFQGNSQEWRILWVRPVWKADTPDACAEPNMYAAMSLFFLGKKRHTMRPGPTCQEMSGPRDTVFRVDRCMIHTYHDRRSCSPARTHPYAASPIRQGDDDACFARTTWASERGWSRPRWIGGDAWLMQQLGMCMGSCAAGPGGGDSGNSVKQQTSYAALPCTHAKLLLPS